MAAERADVAALNGSLAPREEGLLGNRFSWGDPMPGETVLDLGSGADFDALLAITAVGQAGRVFGVDMTLAMIEKARADTAVLGWSMSRAALAISRRCLPHAERSISSSRTESTDRRSSSVLDVVEPHRKHRSDLGLEDRHARCCVVEDF